MKTLDGFPIDQASDAARLRLSCAIAMRGDAKLKVLRIRTAPYSTPTLSQVLQQDAPRRPATKFWIEQVDTTGKVGIVIEDGRVKT